MSCATHSPVRSPARLPPFLPASPRRNAMSKGTTASLLVACAVLAACESPAHDDLTSPTPSITRDVTRFRGPGRQVTRSDGSISFAPATEVSLRALINAALPAPGTTTQCDQGEIVEDTDENGVPNGIFF